MTTPKILIDAIGRQTRPLAPGERHGGLIVERLSETRDVQGDLVYECKCVHCGADVRCNRSDVRKNKIGCRGCAVMKSRRIFHAIYSAARAEKEGTPRPGHDGAPTQASVPSNSGIHGIATHRH